MPHNHSACPDHGAAPYIFNMHNAADMNTHFRTAFWTGNHLQLTLMCIPVGGDIGVELHTDTDQFIGVESGCAKVFMGHCRGCLCEKDVVGAGDAILIPAGTWHNIVNIGKEPLKLYSLYAPPHHPFGTVHKTKADAEKAEKKTECLPT